MTEQNDRPDEAPETTPSEDAPSEGAPRPSFRDALRGFGRAASEMAEAGVEEARKLAEAARPEVERRARQATQQAKAAAEAARPHVEQKAREATEYVREHQDDILRASKRGASVAASGAARAATPGPLRPAVDAMQRELRNAPDAEDAATLEDDDANPGEDAGDDQPPPRNPE